MKRILFVIPTISCGGAERGLVELLKRIDYTQYKVDLMLFRKDDLYYLNQIPQEVNILENDEETQLAFNHVKHLVKFPILIKKANVVFYRIWETAVSKIRRFLKVKKYYYNWKSLKKYVPNLKEEYDVAIGFLEGNSIYYIIEKVKAKKKIGFFRTDYIKGGFQKEFDIEYFKELDCLFSVSEELTKEFKEMMPEIQEKFKTMYNILDEKEVYEKANQPIEFDNQYHGNKIVSVGNLRYVKGYDLAIRTSKILKEKGYQFKWYILGEGKERRNLERLIKKCNVEDKVQLLGLIKNPYAYMKQCDIYVQLSRHEGLSTTIREAKVLKKPIVITNCPGMKNQIKNGYNGTITNYEPEEIASKVAELLDSQSLREKYSTNLENENIHNSIEEQMQVLYNEW